MRRFIAAGTGLAIAGILAAYPGFGSASTTGAWRTFHGDSPRDGVSTAAGPTSSTASNIWTALPRAAVKASPVVDSAGTAYIANTAGMVFALSISKPTPLWTFTAGEGISAAPTLSADEKTLYFTADDGVVYAVDTTTGKQTWAADITASSASPLLSADGSAIFVPSGNSIVALKTSDGSQLWKSAIGGNIIGSLALSPDGTIIYAASNTIEAVYGVPATGTGGGKTLTIYYLSGPATATPAVDSNGSMYVTTLNGTLDSFSQGNASPRWSYKTPNLAAASSTPAIFNGNVIFGTSDGKLLAVNQQGSNVWTVQTGGSIESSAAIAAGNAMIYMTSNDGNLYAYDTNGTQKWAKVIGAEGPASPAIGPDNSVWVSSHSLSWVYRIHEIPNPPAPGKTPTTKPSSTSPAATATSPAPTPTRVVGPAVSLSLKSKVKDGSKQSIKAKSKGNTTIAFDVAYPNGDHQRKSLKTNSKGTVTYSYKQPASKITHTNFVATVFATAGTASAHRTVQPLTASARYTIQLGTIDVSAEPRTQAAGKTVDIWVHARKNTTVSVSIQPSSRVSAVGQVKLAGKTGKDGWAHLKYTVDKKLKAGTTLKVTASVGSGRHKSSTSTNIGNTQIANFRVG